jgi:hypothetical protein
LFNNQDAPANEDDETCADVASEPRYCLAPLQTMQWPKLPYKIVVVSGDMCFFYKLMHPFLFSKTKFIHFFPADDYQQFNSPQIPS